MMNTEPPVPGWTHEQLSELFWHHNRRSLWAAGVWAVLAAVGIALLILRPDIWFIVTPTQTLACVVTVWHRASARMLSKLRFPGRRVV